MNLICGINPVLEALNAGVRHFDRILVVKGLRNRRISEAITRASRIGVPLRFEARETLDRLAGGVPHQGLMAVVSQRPLLDLETLLGQVRDPAFLVVLDGVEDPRNLGAIIRSAEAAGADGVILPDRHSAGLSETTARASAGALEYVKVARVGNVAQAIEALKARGIWTVGYDAMGPERWDAVDLRRPVALVLGGEGRGIRRLVRERCDHLVSLPLFGHVASLNVSVAAGVAFYELIRQRGAVPSHVRPIPIKQSGPALRQVVGPAQGDTEHDPGNVAPVFAPAETGDEEDEAPMGLIQIHEDAAWSFPTAPASEAPRQRRPRPASEEQGPPPGRGPRSPSAGPEASAPREDTGPGKGRDGRRRRRGRRPPVTGSSTPNQGARPRTPPAASGESPAGGASSTAVGIPDKPTVEGAPGRPTAPGERPRSGRRRRRRRG
jgi:23S rRNA (guanosine2251-2'-O)-methyltransferase